MDVVEFRFASEDDEDETVTGRSGVVGCGSFWSVIFGDDEYSFC